MPDIYISLKKNEYPSYYTKVMNKGLLYQFAFDYIDKNRNQLKQFTTFNNFDKSFNITDNILNEFIDYCDKNGIKKQEYKSELNTQNPHLLKVQLKANIARTLLNEEAFLRIENTIDLTVERGVEELSKVK